MWASLFVGEFTVIPQTYSLLWNYVNKMIDVSSSLTGFKASIRKSKADLEVLSFDKEIAIVCLSVCMHASTYLSTQEHKILHNMRLRLYKQRLTSDSQ